MIQRYITTFCEALHNYGYELHHSHIDGNGNGNVQGDR